MLAALRAHGIASLWQHQAEALEAAWAGPMIVTTGTASGKSLCFNLPALDVLCRDAKARALYLYPTKALAQDQARAINAFGLTKQVRPAIYDGDTAREQRTQIRRRANLVLTNPDMLHMGILPHHRAWGDFFSNLAVVVVDEAHVYRGVFGSHVANVLRRLRRIANAYGTEPRFLLASATIANPVELAERLTGLDEIALVDRDGSPGARRQIAMWNPPLTDPALGTRASALGEAAEIVTELAHRGARTICFIKSRKAVELVARLVGLADPELKDLVVPYRAGYTPQQRRELEGKLMRGELLAVITTDALELGIDIGALDAAVVVTFPGTVASLRQMWGRAGRRGRGLAVYVAGEDALDQFFCRHPEEFLAACGRGGDPRIRERADPPRAPAVRRARGAVERVGRRHARAALGGARAGARHDRRTRPALRRLRPAPPRGLSRRDAVALRSASPDTVAIVDVANGELLGTVEASRAHSTVHDGAVYLHQARPYIVRGLDLESSRALVEPFDGSFYTQPKKETMTEIEALLDRRSTLGVTLSFGRVSVTEQVLAYQRKKLPSHEIVDLQALDLPQTTFQTQALWYELDGDVLADDFPLEVLLGSLHAAEHAQIAVLPLLAMCDRWDIGGLSTNAHPQTGGPTIFIYDGHPGGVGITRQGFRCFETLVADAHRLIAECPCKHGCPSCVQSPKCGNLNEPLAKNGALEVMARMLER